jgi:hypothetical protein
VRTQQAFVAAQAHNHAVHRPDCAPCVSLRRVPR